MGAHHFRGWIMSKLLKKIVIVVFCFFAATESVHAMQASVKRWGRREMRIGAAVIAGVCALGLLVRHVMQAYTAVDQQRPYPMRVCAQ
jgi:ABC-type arginine transport system permease subunit